MKTKLMILFFSSASFSLTLVPQTLQALTYLEHQMSVNQLMCEKMVAAKQAPSVEECTKKFDAISGANPINKTIQVDASKSGACVGSLFGAKVDDIMTKSVEGPCSLEVLQASGPAAAPSPPATEQPSAAPAEQQAAFKVGDAVMAFWGQSWWNAQIIKVQNGKYCVKWDGYDDSWNECGLGLDRLKSK